MNKELNINLKYCLLAEDFRVRFRSHVPARIFFLQGVLHSSSLPDYIEDKKSGGQNTDRLINTSLCNDSTIIIGREARKGRMLKTVI